MEAFVDTSSKMKLAATPNGINASNDTKAKIDFPKTWIRSKRRRLKTKLCREGFLALKCDAKNLILPGENMLPEKHSSFHPSVDRCSKNEFVRKRSNGDVSLSNRHSAPEGDGVLNLQMEHGEQDKHLEEQDTAKTDLAAAPIGMYASIDTIVHSKLKLHKQGVHSHEHSANKNQVIAGVNSLSETILCLQPSVDIHSKNELVVKHSIGDVCLFDGGNVSENKRPINMQMAN